MKKIWNAILFIVGIILGGIVVYNGKKMSGSKPGKIPEGSDPFTPAAGKDDVIEVKTDRGLQSVKLPKGVKAENVKSVKYEEGAKKSVVETKHVPKDRRNVSPIADSALGRIRGKLRSSD